MFAPDAGTAASTWRPQRFGDRRAAQIADPIIEPLWTGPRVLVLTERGTVRMTDTDGLEIDGHDEVRDDLADAVAGATMLLEAYLTPEPIEGGDDLAGREEIPIPQAGKALTQMVFGQRGAKSDRLVTRTEEARRRSAADSTSEVALVAVDLLWLDDEPLLDVPLLERKRILESVLPESHLIRRGIHVRPPVDTWLGSWRTFGFSRLAYKGANSRYVPGEKNQHWALAEIPRR
jgi:hypothetical protein